MGQALRRASGRLRSSAVDKSPAPPIKTPLGPTPPAVPFDKVSGDSAVSDSSMYTYIYDICMCVYVCWKVC